MGQQMLILVHIRSITVRQTIDKNKPRLGGGGVYCF